MNAKTDFWLHLSRLADAYDEGGLTSQERVTRAMQQFEHMPHLAQREMLAALRSMAFQLPDLYTIAANKSIEMRMERTGEARAAEAG